MRAQITRVWVSGSGEMADTQVLGTCVFGREGSSPFSRTMISTIWADHNLLPGFKMSGLGEQN